MKFRTESDSLGEMKIPEGSFYGASTQRALENFPISGLRFSREMIEALAHIKWAAAEVNVNLKKMDPKLAKAIQKVAEQMAKGEQDSQFVVDVFQTGSGTSLNMNFNEVAANLANVTLGGGLGSKKPIHPNDHVNLGQSSNDVIPTMIHVAAALVASRKLLPSLKRLKSELGKKVVGFKAVVKTGRTHLQDATPMTLGQEFSGYEAQVGYSIERIEMALEGIYELAIGGTAVGTGINTDKQFGRKVSEILAKKTNLPFREARNHFEAQASKDACVFLSGALRTTAVSLMKIANDIRFLAMGPRCGLGELRLPEVQPGSSIMPGKVNPVMAEALLQVCAQVLGNDTAITVAGASGNFELNTMMPVLGTNLLQSLVLLSGAVSVFTDKCVVGLQADKKVIAEMFERNLMLVTALVPLVGYDKAASIAKAAYKQNKTIREMALKMTDLSEKQLSKVLDPKNLI